MPFDLGGFGIKRIREINIFLLCKWYWRLLENQLWLCLLKMKYGSDIGGYFIKKKKGKMGISVWRGLSKVEDLFRRLPKFIVGAGKIISFWLDAWCTKLPLCHVFPSLFKVSSTRNSTVADNYLGESFFSSNWFLGIDPDRATREPQ